MKSFAFDVTDEDFELLERLRHLGYCISVNLDASTGGITIHKDGTSVEWAFISEVDGPDDKTFEDHRAAIIALIDADVQAVQAPDAFGPGHG